MFNPSRDQARQFFFDAWRKRRDGLPLTPLETAAADIVARHPEYHAVFDAPDRGLDRDYLPEQGETNPFLHLAMHLSIAEQVSIDQPKGIRDALEKLATKSGARHEAEHEVMDCLAEMIWQAQRAGGAPDAAVYFACLDRKLRS